MNFLRMPTTVDITWFLDLANNGQLNLTPPYQRRSVWTPKDRRFFLDTIFRGYPSPAIYIFKDTDDKGHSTYNVVDGKQRLETILSFVKNKVAIDKDFGDIRLNGMKWRDIKEDRELARRFWDYIVPIEYIKITDDALSINDVFDRLNRNARTLTDQELRHAKYDGWFISFIENESDHEDWKKIKFITTARKKRMKDVQFLAELLIVILSNKITGFDQDTIDNFHAQYDNPTEYFDAGFDEDQIKESFEKVKKTILAMEQANGCITAYARDYKNFYSLWAVIHTHLSVLPPVAVLANKYNAFMKEVAIIKESFTEDKLLGQYSKEAVTYFKNSTGASTEKPQREARDIALTEALKVQS